MTLRELELKLREHGVPPKLYSLDGGNHIEKYRVLEKRFWWYEVYCVDLGVKHHTYKFKTEEEACDFFYKKLINDCRYTDIPLNGIEPIKHKKPIIAPKWLHEDMAHEAMLFGIDLTYKRDVHSITFENSYKYETTHFFEDRFYKGNAIICLNSSNENNCKNRIGIPDNVFMINDKGERIWTFKRNFIFPDKNVCVDHVGLDYDKDELFLYVYSDEHYRPRYTVDPATGLLLRRYEELARPRRIFKNITFRRRKNI